MKTLGLLTLFVLAVFLRAVVLTDLWDWFMVPLGLVPLLNYWHALGIAIMVSYLTMRFDGKKTDESKAKRLTVALVWSLTVWGFGALYHLGMSGVIS